MSDHDQMTESPELRDLRDSLDGIELLPPPPPLAAIAARGRSHRRQRHSGVAGLVVAGAAAGAALTVALAGGAGTGNDALPALKPGRSHPPRKIATASYTLISDTNGKVKLTIDPRKLFNPARLQSDLARFGVPAKVTDGRFCTSDPQPNGLSRIVTMRIGPPQTITFDPSAIPARTELSFGRFPLKLGAQMVAIALIDASSYTCSTIPPFDRPGNAPARLGYLQIPAGKATTHG
jgi:hypothetical protein